MNNVAINPGKILPTTIGFDRVFNILEKLEKETVKTVSYPPYSIAKVTDHLYVIELAVAGFSINDINIETNNNTLTIAGIFPREMEHTTYLYKGISTKDFSHVFKIADNCVVKFATLRNGILRVTLETIIPEEKLPKKIPIVSSD